MLRAASLTALSLLAVLAAACGGGAAAGEADPARAVPANAAFYLEIVVGPEGDLREDAEAAAGKVLRTSEPADRIRELLNRALAASGRADIDFARDVEPNLGERAGIWAGGPLDAHGEPIVAMVVATTDEEAVRSLADEQRRRSYNGVEYAIDADDFAYAVTDGLLLMGDEPAVKRTIDALNGDSLAERDSYRDELDDLDDDRLAHFYLDFRTLIRLAGPSEEELRQIETVVPLDRLGPLVGSFAADGERLALDMSVRTTGASLPFGALAAGGGTPLLEELPGDSWAAFGAARFGESLKAALDGYAGALGGAVLKQQLQRRFGVDLERDVLSWMGDVAYFVRGRSVAELDGGAVIEVTDSERAATGFGVIAGALQSSGSASVRPIRVDGAETAFALTQGSMPKPIVMARSPERVVVTYGADAAADALSSDETLGDSEAFERAADVLGDDLDPALLVSVPAALELAGDDPDVQDARPWLEPYDVIAMGAQVGATRARMRVVAGLR